jgi:PhzF family phenazine biosynthesis protein
MHANMSPTSRQPLQFHIVDVFASAPFGGDPLAVVLGARSLDERSLRYVAREFNLSETTFLVAARVKLRCRADAVR